MEETPRTICVFGAGALGGALAVRLATSSQPFQSKISVIARGEHLAAIRKNGLRLWENGKPECESAQVEATDDPASLGPQALVVTALKGHQLPSAAAGIAALMGPATRVVMVQNGIPWWYFHADAESGHEGERIPILDPGGALWDQIGPERVIGCIVYQGAEVVSPGEIRITPNGRFILGELAGEITPALESISAVIARAGWRTELTACIRDEVWRKLMGNAAFNPISALTRATLADMIDDPAVAGIVRSLMNEVCAVGVALGAKFDVTPDRRMAVSRPMGAIKTSMLQDLERGRSMEIVPLLEAPVYLGQVAGVKTPVLEMIRTLVSRLEQSTASRV